MSPEKGAPSTITSGALPALIEEIPRMRMVGVVVPGAPEALVSCTPATLELRALRALLTCDFSICEASTTAADPVKASLVALP